MKSAASDNPRSSPSLFGQKVFSRLFAGSVASSLGSSAGMLAITWLVYTVTFSTFDVALVGIAGIIPRVVFGIFSGALSDRYGRLNVMIVADFIRAFTMIIFATSLIIFGFDLYVVLGAAFILGLGQILFRPAINSFLPTAVPRESLGTANALFTTAESATSIIGSPLGGVLIGAFGVAATLYFNGASYITSGLFIVVVSLSLSSTHKFGTGKKEASGNQNAQQQKSSFLQEVRGGFAYVNSERGLLKLTIASFGANFFLLCFSPFL